MGLTCLLPAVLVAAAGLSPTPAADLSKLDRTVPDEPTYHTLAPKYCLLAFGPDARTTAWLVHDGNVVHLHASPDGKAAKAWRRVTSGSSNFVLGDIWAGGTCYKNLQFSPNRHTYRLSVRVGEHRQAAGRDRAGALELAATAKDAPVVHFDGPLTLGLYFDQEPLRSEAAVDLSVVVGTPGVGPGTFALLFCSAYPNGAWPTAVVEYPSGATTRVRLAEE